MRTKKKRRMNKAIELWGHGKWDELDVNEEAMMHVPLYRRVLACQEVMIDLARYGVATPSDEDFIGSMNRRVKKEDKMTSFSDKESKRIHRLYDEARDLGII